MVRLASNTRMLWSMISLAVFTFFYYASQRNIIKVTHLQEETLCLRQELEPRTARPVIT